LQAFIKRILGGGGGRSGGERKEGNKRIRRGPEEKVPDYDTEAQFRF